MESKRYNLLDRVTLGRRRCCAFVCRGQPVLNAAHRQRGPMNGLAWVQICLTAAAETLRAGMQVHWIDLLGAFRASRLQEILLCRGAPTQV